MKHPHGQQKTKRTMMTCSAPEQVFSESGGWGWVELFEQARRLEPHASYSERSQASWEGKTQLRSITERGEAGTPLPQEQSGVCLQAGNLGEKAPDYQGPEPPGYQGIQRSSTQRQVVVRSSHEHRTTGTHGKLQK